MPGRIIAVQTGSIEIISRGFGTRTHDWPASQESRLATSLSAAPQRGRIEGADTHGEGIVLPVKRGEWTDHDGTVITLALDAKGRKAFYQLYRDLPHFSRCMQPVPA